MSDDFTLDLGDLPEIPEAPSTRTIEDTFAYPVGFKFSFVGVGQAGGRIAKTFQDIGYKRVCAVNTAKADLAELTTFPEQAKLSLGEQQGAGKDPATAAAVAKDKDEDIFDLLSRCWGSDTDYGFICLSAAGGTGAGTYSKVAQVAKRFLREKKRPNRVGVIMALPKDSEGARSAKNTLYTVRELQSLNLSPIIFVDNERFKQLYGDNITVQQEKPKSNSSTALLLHSFNRLAGTDSEDVGGTTFDATDFSRLLDSGVVAFAAVTLKKWSNPSDISTPIRNQLQNNVLASVKLQQGKVAGLLYVISGEAWNGAGAVTVSLLDHGTEMMNRIMQAPDSAVFTGVYPSNDAGSMIKVLAMVGGLPLPVDRLRELAGKSGEPVDKISEALGI